MKIKTVQWNIGGGLIRSEEADPTDPNSFCEDGLDHITEVLERESPDIVTLQEVQERNEYCQTQIIATSIGLPFWVSHATDKSFFDPEKFIGQAVLSRFPIIASRFTPFTNPGFSVCDANDKILRSRNGGLTTCTIQMPCGSQIEIQTFHLVPFYFFNVDLHSVEAEGVMREFESVVGNPKYRTILQGDFNVDFVSLRSILPNLFEKGFDESHQPDPTTPKGKRLDHTLFSGLMNTEMRVISDVRSDHYPVVSVMLEESAKTKPAGCGHICGDSDPITDEPNLPRSEIMTQKYSVYVDDNFHAYDEDERYLKGEYETLDEAISIAKKMVDDFLARGYKEGMSASTLLNQYRGYGEDPFIMPGDGGVPFSAWSYAEARCNEICGTNED